MSNLDDFDIILYSSSSSWQHYYLRYREIHDIFPNMPEPLGQYCREIWTIEHGGGASAQKINKKNKRRGDLK